MIKFVAKSRDTGRELVGLGLSDDNIKRMQEHPDNPIFFKGEELGLAGKDIVIMCYGKEDDAGAALQKLGFAIENIK